jgi:hypothetical protein
MVSVIQVILALMIRTRSILVYAVAVQPTLTLTATARLTVTITVQPIQTRIRKMLMATAWAIPVILVQGIPPTPVDSSNHAREGERKLPLDADTLISLGLADPVQIDWAVGSNSRDSS